MNIDMRGRGKKVKYLLVIWPIKKVIKKKDSLETKINNLDKLPYHISETG